MPVRDLSKAYKIRRRPFVRGKYGQETPLRGLALQEHGRVRMRTVFVGPEGKEARERRRLNPQIAGRLAHQEEIAGTAAELYLNQGIDRRGLGTKTSARGKKRAEKHN